MTNYANHFKPENTQQSEPLLNEKMVMNNAGGYVYEISKIKRLERFLILGATGNTYYQDQRDLIKQNYNSIRELILENPEATIDLVKTISDEGRAISNNPAIFVLAIMMSDPGKARKLALKEIKSVCRTGTHILTLANYFKTLGKWGRSVRRSFAEWYTKKTPDSLAYQVIKYRNRESFTHRDLIRLCHPKSDINEISNIIKFVVKDKVEGVIPDIITGYNIAKTATTEKEFVSLIEKYKLTWEMLPTEALNYKGVWETLLNNSLKYEALIRNLGKMSSIGLLTDLSQTSRKAVELIRNIENIRESRIHPIKVYTALSTYGKGQGIKGSLSWSPVSAVVSALNDAFYDSFKNVKPSNKNIMIALDVSGSMGSNFINKLNITAREAAALMAMVTMRTEPNHAVYCFSHKFIKLNITPNMSLNQIVETTKDLPFGATDCALPMMYANKEKLDVDSFIIYTDNETWYGSVHPSVALREYRNKYNKNAKLAVVGMTATEFSIVDQTDRGCMDFVGFDSNTPAAISNFISE